MNSNSSTNDVFGGSSHASALLAHEVRNLVNIAILSIEVLKISGAGVMGREGRVLRRSLNDLRTLVNRALSDTRTAHSREDRHVIDVGDFINEIEAAATLEAQARPIGTSSVPPSGISCRTPSSSPDLGPR
jgi:signal transduction histidine kinase